MSRNSVTIGFSTTSVRNADSRLFLRNADGAVIESHELTVHFTNLPNEKMIRRIP